MELHKRFRDAYENRHELALSWKRDGGKIFGYFCSHVPEELIWAAGILPVQIRGSTENITLADAHLQPYVCSFARGCLDQALKGVYHYLDGVVFPKTCEVVRMCYGIWEKNLKPSYIAYLPIPGKKTSEAKEYYAKELRNFKRSLEEYMGRGMVDEDIHEAIKIYNENRSLLQKLYRMRQRQNPPLSGSQIFDVVRAGFVLPKTEHNKMLKELLGTLTNLPERPDTSRLNKRLLLVGNTFENEGLLLTIEDLGGEVVSDDLCVGTRYFWQEVRPRDDLIMALADGYLEKTPCPCRYPSFEERLQNILNQVEEYDAKGVIFLIQKFCDSHLIEYPHLEGQLRNRNIPTLFLEVEDRFGPEAQFRTRVQAFLEIL